MLSVLLGTVVLGRVYLLMNLLVWRNWRLIPALITITTIFVIVRGLSDFCFRCAMNHCNKTRDKTNVEKVSTRLNISQRARR